MAAGIIGAALLSNGASSSPWRPPQWQASPLYYILISGSQNAPANTTTTSASGVMTMTASGTTSQMYVPDAVMRVEHQQEAHITEHPVQTGANISDHAYAMPARVTLDIGISDAMAAYTSSYAPNAVPWVGAAVSSKPSKSVNAFATISSWVTGRVLVTLGTRLKVYSNMMVESIAPEETNKTKTSLRCRVTFKQVFIANVQQVAASALPQTTQLTSSGVTTSTPLSASQTAQFGETANPLAPTVIGSGTLSSSASAEEPVG
jgi:hypothetical protein